MPGHVDHDLVDMADMAAEPRTGQSRNPFRRLANAVADAFTALRSGLSDWRRCPPCSITLPCNPSVVSAPPCSAHISAKDNRSAVAYMQMVTRASILLHTSLLAGGAVQTHRHLSTAAPTALQGVPGDGAGAVPLPAAGRCFHPHRTAVLDAAADREAAGRRARRRRRGWASPLGQCITGAHCVRTCFHAVSERQPLLHAG